MKPSEVRILAVDDDAMMLEMIKMLFLSFRFQVDTASSGNQAWALAQKQNYDLVLTDIRMPDGDGIELAERLKSRCATKPRVLMISGFSDMTLDEIYHIGVEGMFAKPFDSTTIRAAIRTCLEAPGVKWGRELCSDPVLNIKETAKNIAELNLLDSVHFGRGGFFVGVEPGAAVEGSNVHFSIKVEEPTPIEFVGGGKVRWINSHAGINGPQGLGVEITHLPMDQAELYSDMFGELTPFIPSPARMSKRSSAA